MEENEKTGSTPEIEDQPPESTETPPNPEPEQPSLEELAKAYNMTPDQVIKSYGEAQRKITQQGQELSTTRKKYQWADQFAHVVNTEKGFREYIEDYPGFRGGENVPSEVRGAIDPVLQRMNELEVKLLSSEMNTRIDALAQQYPVDATTRQQIFEEISRTANPDIEAIYFKIKGPEFFSQANGEALREAGKSKNRQAYVQNRGGAPTRKADDIKSLSKSEWSDALDNEIGGLFRTTN